MKYLLAILTLFTFNLDAQTLLKFDKRFVECEDQWVAFQKGKDSTHIYGFIYIDAQAGLTLNYGGNFTIAGNGLFIPQKNDSANLKIRLESNNVLVAPIPTNKFDELKIPPVPEWLKFYKTDTASVARLVRWGYLYNGWNECAKALTFLEKAQKLDAGFEGLSVELAFSYNCLGRFDQAMLVLQDAVATNPTDAYINKELIYAQIKSNHLEKALESCKRAIAVCADKAYHGENCYNLLHSFYSQKDWKNFWAWLPETKKWSSSNADITGRIKAMEESLAK